MMYTMVINTSTDRVSAQNYHDLWSYCQKGHFGPNLVIFGPSLVHVVSKIAKFERMFQFSDVYHRNTSTDGVSAQIN